MARRYSAYEEKFRQLFRKHAELFPKKHGEWAIFRFPEEGTFLAMDTWNGAFWYAVGSGEYEYWKGFEGTLFMRFGGNESWSDPCHAKPDHIIKFYARKLYREVGRRMENG